MSRAESKQVVPKVILMMKVGFHGAEELEDIIKRKQDEIKQVGYCFWGYGGTLCHPIRLVQPFVNSLFSSKGEIEVLFVETKSPFRFQGTLAKEYSPNGSFWTPIPNGIRVASSRFALVLAKLKRVNLEIDISQYKIAYGPSKGKSLGGYLRGRVDKALAIASPDGDATTALIPVAFRAVLVAPYAILVR